nr:MAG TPA: hypothetical protein [Caudoviricetes sp.]
MLLFEQYACAIVANVLCAILCVYSVTIPLIELTTKRACVNRARACVWVGLIHR